MSDIEFGRFIAKTGKDHEAAKAFVLAVGDKQGDEAIAAVAAFARARGFDVTSEDAAKARQSIVTASDTNRDLADDELDGVEGGVVLETALIIGAGAAVMAGIGVIAGVSVGATAISVAMNAGDNPVGNWFKQW